MARAGRGTPLPARFPAFAGPLFTARSPRTGIGYHGGKAVALIQGRGIAKPLRP